MVANLHMLLSGTWKTHAQVYPLLTLKEMAEKWLLVVTAIFAKEQPNKLGVQCHFVSMSPSLYRIELGSFRKVGPDIWPSIIHVHTYIHVLGTRQKCFI